MRRKRARETIGSNQHDHLLDEQGLRRLIAMIKAATRSVLLTHPLYREVAPQGGGLSVQQSAPSEEKPAHPTAVAVAQTPFP